MKCSQDHPYLCLSCICVYTNLTAVTVGFTEMTYSGDESDVTTTLECVVTMTGQLERELLVDISTEDGTATGWCFNLVAAKQ